MKKIISFVLAAVLLVSAVPTALATNDYSQGTQVVYEATGSESYTITVPAQLAPGGNGTVTLEGTWADNRIITVTAEPTVTLTNSIKADDQKVLDVTFAGISEAGSNTGSQTFTEAVSVANIENALFGTWSGKFNYNVEVRSSISNFTMSRLCLEHDLGVEMVYGEEMTYKGVTKTNESAKRTGFIPVDLFVNASLTGNNITSYAVFDKDKNYIRGYWGTEGDDFYVDPEQGEAFVMFGMSTHGTCIFVSQDTTISAQSKTFEIFGDSWSAFDTSIVDSNWAYYGETGTVNDPVHGYEQDVQSNSDMWYSVFEERTGWTLVRNDSASGSCMSYSYYGGEKDDPRGTSYITRMRDRFEGSGANLGDPDVIFIFGGTNDYGAGAELGEAMYSGWTENDLNDVLPATCYILDYLKQQAPNTKLVFILNYFPNNPEMMTGIKSICDYYGVDYVDWCMYSIQQNTSHPTKAGMTQIADQIINDLSKKDIF